MNPLKIGIIGAGNIARTAHMPAYRNNPHAKLFAVADISKRSREQTAKKFHIPKVYEDPIELIEKSGVNAVSICTPPVNHQDLVIRCAEQGIHVLCEKPFAMNSSEAQVMTDVAKSKGINLAAGFSLRFFPNMQIIKQHLDAGKLGFPHTISALYHQQTPGTEWMYNEKISGGGVIADKGSHVFDLLFWWLQSEVKDLEVITTNYRNSDVEELAQLLLTFENKTTAFVSLSWLTSRDVVNFTVCGTAAVAKGGYRYLEIGYADLLQTDMYKNGKRALTNILNLFTIYPPPGEDPYQTEINDFVSSILNDRPPCATGIDGVRNMKIIDRAYQKIAEKEGYPQ